MNTEPTLRTEYVRSFILLLTSFGLVLTQDQQTAILAALPAIFAVVSFGLAWYNRSRVFSPATTQKIANAATYESAGTVVDIGNPPSGPSILIDEPLGAPYLGPDDGAA